MKRQFSILLQLLILLALGACGLTKTNLSPMPNPTGTIQPTRLPDPMEKFESCPSGEAAAPELVETWNPPPETTSITPLSCDEIGKVFAYDPGAPLDIQEVSQRREEGVTVIDLTYASPMGGRVPATLVVPDGAGPFAGMLYQHGMPKTRQQMIPAGVAYARMGAVVLLIDAPYVRRTNGGQIDMTEQARRKQIQFIVDLRRGIDMLLSRAEVDPERLGYVGLSYGAFMGGLLAGVEDRLKAYVLQSGDGGLVLHLNNRNYRGEWQARPEEERRQWVAWMWPIEPIHYVGCASPAALLFQNGTLDTVVYPVDALPFQETGSQPKTVRWYCSDHSLNAAALRDQAEFLSEMIGISPFPVNAQVLAAYAGRYQISNDIMATIRVDGTHIYFQLPDEPVYEPLAGENELFAGSEDRFYLGATYIEFTFYRNDSSDVERVVLSAEGKTLEAKKVP
jgi:poly(3-hydroxybutyrate) depolymerase